VPGIPFAECPAPSGYYDLGEYYGLGGQTFHAKW
jgi:hypothetical protein